MLAGARLALAIAVLVGGAAGTQARASGCNPPERILLAPAARAATLEGGVPRGLRDCYRFAGQKEERLSISQPRDSSGTIVFQIYRPPWRVRENPSGVEIAGTALPGARAGEDARSWRGLLPVSGEYLLVVGAMRGGGPYQLSVKLR